MSIRAFDVGGGYDEIDVDIYACIYIYEYMPLSVYVSMTIYQSM